MRRLRSAVQRIILPQNLGMNRRLFSPIVTASHCHALARRNLTLRRRSIGRAPQKKNKKRIKVTFIRSVTGEGTGRCATPKALLPARPPGGTKQSRYSPTKVTFCHEEEEEDEEDLLNMTPTKVRPRWNCQHVRCRHTVLPVCYEVIPHFLH